MNKINDFQNTYKSLYWFLIIVKYPLSLLSIYLGVSFFKDVIQVLLKDQMHDYILIGCSIFFLIIIETVKYISTSIFFKGVLYKKISVLFLVVFISSFSLSIISSLTGSNNINSNHIDSEVLVIKGQRDSLVQNTILYYDSIIREKTKSIKSITDASTKENIYYYKTIQDRLNLLQLSIDRVESDKKIELSKIDKEFTNDKDIGNFSKKSYQVQITVFITEMFLIFCLYFSEWYLYKKYSIVLSTPLTAQAKNTASIKMDVKKDQVTVKDKEKLVLDIYRKTKPKNTMEIAKILHNKVSQAEVYRIVKRLKAQRDI